MSDKLLGSELTFADTNILVYLYDPRDSAKQESARKLINKLAKQERIVISSQVLQEFCNVTIGKLSMSTSEVKKAVEIVLGRLVAHTPDLAFYLRAIELFEAHALSYYDALIVQAALDLGCTTLYSEDLQHGQTFGPLTIINPFI